MRFDMHCHTSEGSLDARVSIFTVVDQLKAKGFDGVLITDHNSYRGYETWVESGREDFVVLKGIEYDTSDAGHMIIIMPQYADTSIFLHRGMNLKKLLEVVHRLGGMVGPAHPYSYSKFGIFNHHKWRRQKAVTHRFDFIEAFNSCTFRFSNNHAAKLARVYHRPAFGGSDNHRLSGIGLGYTDISANIRNNDDLLNALQNGASFKAGGHYNQDSFACAHSFIYSCAAHAWYMINRVRFWATGFKRKKAIRSTIFNEI